MSEESATEMKGSRIFWWGFFGSILPQINALRVSVIEHNSHPAFDIVVIGVAIMLAVVAGFICLAWKPEHPLKAIYIGVAWPYMLSAFSHAVTR